MRRIGAPLNAALIDADALARGIAANRTDRLAVVLNQHGVIDISAE